MHPDSFRVHPCPLGGPLEQDLTKLPSGNCRMMPFHLQVHERSQNFAEIQPSRFYTFVVRPGTAPSQGS